MRGVSTMKKQIKLFLVFTVTILTLVVVSSLFTSNAETYEEFTYEISEDEIKITGCIASTNCINVPSEIDGYPVTGIDIRAFEGCSNITSIVIPKSVTKIGISAFYGCNNLEEITLPFIGDQQGESYYGVNQVFGSIFGGTKVNESETVKQYYSSGSDSYSCYYIPQSLKKVTITNETKIPYGAFYNCSMLEEIIIRGELKNIDKYAFYNCNNLISITLPESITSIGDTAFGGCTSLKDIILPKNLKTIGSSAFSGCNGLTNIIIPEGVTSIGPFAYAGCGNIISISLPKTLANIGACAFENCENIEELHISDLTSYCNIAYMNPSSSPLFNATNVTVYLNNQAVTNLIVPYGVTNISNSAFEGCNNLTSVIIPESVLNIGASAFKNCNNLEEITLPFIGVEQGGTDASYDVFGYIFGYSSYEENNTIKQCYKTINNYNYYYIPQSLRKVTITNETLIPYGAFYNCSMLEEIVINSGVTNIDTLAFSSCTNLKEITIPKSVTTLGANIFNECDLIIKGIPRSEANIYANKELIYFIPSDGSNPSKLDGDVFGTSTMWSLYEDGRLLFSGTMTPNFEYCDDAPWYKYESFISTAEFSNGITSIGKYTLGSHIKKYNRLKKVVISDTVSNINIDAFSNSTIKEFAVDSGNENYSTDYGVLFDKNQTTLIKYNSGSEVSNYTIPKTVKTISNSAFENANNLTSIEIANNVTSIGEYAFDNCSALESIVLSSNLKTIPYGMFFECISLKNINIPESVTTIEWYAFYNCENLEIIVIPKTVTKIHNSVFDGCYNLTIHGYSKSTVQAYAQNNNIAFKILGASVEFPSTSKTKRVSINGTDVVTGITPGMTILQLQNTFKNVEDADVHIVNNNDVVVENGTLSSGYRIVVSQDDEIIEELIIYVLGDTDGNGTATTKDINNIMRFIEGSYLPTYWIAADFDGNLQIDYSDLMIMLRIVAERTIS